MSLRTELHAWLIVYELGQMERFLELLHTAIKDGKEELTTSIEEQTNSLSDDEKKKFYEYYDQELIEWDDDFPRLVFSSFIVSWYSLIERHLLDFCSNHELQITISIEDRENYGEGIRRAQKFLQRAAGYAIATKYWEELNRIKQLRNIIVHEQGRLLYSRDAFPKSISVKLVNDEIVYLQIEEHLLRYLQTNNLFKRAGTFKWLYIMPTLEYCQYLIKFGKEFFLKLHQDFWNKTDRDSS
jgi:hypothetical protein